MKTIIKSTVAALTVVVMISTSLYAQDNIEASKMLKDMQKKEQVFNAILQDSVLKKEMMQRMMKDAEKDSTTCKMMGSMIMDDDHMQDMMMSNMMDKAGEDDGMCKKMCMMMMDNEKMMNMMDKMKMDQINDEEDKKTKSNKKVHLDSRHPKDNKNK